MMNEFKNKTLLARLKSKGYSAEDLVLFETSFGGFSACSIYLKLKFKDDYIYLCYDASDEFNDFEPLDKKINDFVVTFMKSKKSSQAFFKLIRKQIRNKIIFDKKKEIYFNNESLSDFSLDLKNDYKNVELFLEDLEGISMSPLINKQSEASNI